MFPADRHLSFVANGFRAAGWILGIPSLAAFLFLACVWISLRPGQPIDASGTDIGKYGLVGLLSTAAYGVAKVFEFFGGATRWAAGILAMVSLATTLLGAGLFFIGRGLFAHALWARIIAGLVTLVLLLASYGGLTASHRGGAMFCLLLIGVEGYILWVLGWRFA